MTGLLYRLGVAIKDFGERTTQAAPRSLAAVAAMAAAEAAAGATRTAAKAAGAAAKAAARAQQSDILREIVPWNSIAKLVASL